MVQFRNILEMETGVELWVKEKVYKDILEITNEISVTIIIEPFSRQEGLYQDHYNPQVTKPLKIYSKLYSKVQKKNI